MNKMDRTALELTEYVMAEHKIKMHQSDIIRLSEAIPKWVPLYNHRGEEMVYAMLLGFIAGRE